MNNPFRRRSATDLSMPAKVGAFLLLLAWALVVLFPIYWLIVTSFKTPYDVDKGPFYVPFVDFQPTLDAWHYILVDLGNDTLRPYINTVIVGLTSSVIALAMGSLTAYALVRFSYRPKLGLIGVGIGCIAFAFVTVAIGAPLPIAITAAVAIFFLLAQTIGRRFRRTLANSDIAFWLISQQLGAETYVMPAPEENHAAFYEHLLRRNDGLVGRPLLDRGRGRGVPAGRAARRRCSTPPSSTGCWARCTPPSSAASAPPSPSASRRASPERPESPRHTPVADSGPGRIGRTPLSSGPARIGEVRAGPGVRVPRP